MVPLSAGTKVVVDAGAYRFLVSATARPKSHAQPLLGGVRWDEQTYLAGSAIAHVLVLIGLLSVPRDARALGGDEIPQLVAQGHFIITPQLAKEDPFKNLAKLPGDAKVEGKEGKRMAGEESLAGNPKSKEHGKAFAIKGPADNKDPGMPKRLINDMINNNGPVSVLGRYSSSSLGSIYGREGALGDHAVDFMGEMKPGDPGDSWGQGGWGNKPGKGKGGGGDGYGTVGLGRIGTFGIYGNGDKSYGGHVGGTLKRKATVPDPIVGVPDIKGRLDKELIRRIVRRHLNEVKFCYEQEAIRHPDLSGRLVVQFTITGNGSVSSSAVGKSMGNAVVDQCVTQAVRRWEFPSPEGGGVVIVSYPFVLTMSGS
jgi:TonB family protein